MPLESLKDKEHRQPRDAAVRESCLRRKEGTTVMAPWAEEEDKKKIAKARNQNECRLAGK